MRAPWMFRGKMFEANPARWRSSGRSWCGPRVSAPNSKGFGLSLIERSKNLPYLLMNLEFAPTGLVCRMKIDADRARKHNRAYFSPHRSYRV